jgi:predicted DCC family thiol-disulfide oxidoreductase YuxK
MSPSGTSPGSNDTVIVYDGECPFCSSYVRLLRLRESIGPVALVNARDEAPAVEEARSHGLDLDEGMAMKYQGRWYHGDDCIHMLALLSSRSGLANRLMAWLFRSPARAHILYPWMRAGRNITLKLLGRQPIVSV